MRPQNYCVFLLLGLCVVLLSITTSLTKARQCSRREFNQVSLEDYDEGSPGDEEAPGDDGAPGGGQRVKLPEDCGRHAGSLSRRHLKSSYPRISNGFDAEIGQFPSFAELQLFEGESSGFFQCGGTIITSRHILTASHCFPSNPNLEQSKVGIGLETFANYGAKDLEIGIEKVCKSPKFRQQHSFRKSREPFVVYDVAIIKLKEDIEFTDTIQPACLPVPGSPMTDDQQAYSIGMGTQYYNPDTEERTTGDTLKVLPVLKSKCFERHESIICHKANIPDYMGVVCTGDSGGPVLALDAEGRQTVYGIHSYGDKACMGFPKGLEHKYINANADVHNLREEIDKLLEECA